MSENSLQEQLVKYLTDVHSIEEQALTQLRRAPDMAENSEIADAFSQHLSETERQEERIRERLAAHESQPSKVKDIAGKAGGIGMAMFAGAQPDTPGKLVAHAYSYEHLEVAAYELLRRVAERASDQETATVAREIAAEERRMAGRLESLFDRAADAALRELDPENIADQARKYLADAHAIEEQAIELLRRAPKITQDEELASLYEAHLDETREHERKVSDRLEAVGGSTSTLKDAALRLGALNWGGFFAAQPDTPAKLAGFAFAFEHLEIAAYRLLQRVGSRAGDEETVGMAEGILADERGAAEKLAARWDVAVEASLSKVVTA